ncbi:MAG: hypothetical protein AB7V42_15640 [Thermoleophilia bacterium]
MTTTAKHLIRIALAAGTAALAAVLLLCGPGRAAGGTTETLHVYDKVLSVKMTRADGTVVGRPPYPEPAPGDTIDIVSLEYAGNHGKHARRPFGSGHARCVFPAQPGPPDCVSHIAIASSMLVFEGDPGTLVLGTGRYRGAKGRVLSSVNVGGGNDSDIVARITRR